MLDGSNARPIDGRDALEVFIEFGFGCRRILLRAQSQALRKIGKPVFQIVEMLARFVRAPDDRDEPRLIGESASELRAS